MNVTTIGSGIRASLPNGWKLVELGDLCEHNLGKMLDGQKNVGVSRPYLRNPNVKWFGFDLADVKAPLVLLEPPLANLIHFDKASEAIRESQNLAIDAAREADDLFNSLVQRAFKGEL